MSISDEIENMAAGLAQHKVPTGAFCDKAGINPSTWQRWRNGDVMPNMRSFEAAKTAYDALIEAARTAEAAPETFGGEDRQGGVAA